MAVTAWSPEPAIEFKGIFVHPNHLAAMAPSPSSSISSALTCVDFSDEEGDYSMQSLVLDSPATVVGEDDCDDYFTFGSPKYSPKSLPPVLSPLTTCTNAFVASPVPVAQPMSRVASSSMSRSSPRLVRTPSLYGNENANPAHFPASVPFSMFSPQPSHDAVSPAPASPAAFPASCFFASRPPSPAAGSPAPRPSPYSRKNSVASLKASSGGASMVRCVSSPVETMRQVAERDAARAAMTSSIDSSASRMARSRSVAAGMPLASSSSSSSNMARSSIGLGFGGVAMARSPKQRGTPFGEGWGAALPPREEAPAPAPLPFPYNVERTKPTPPTRLVRAYSMVNTLAAAAENVAPVASPVLAQNRPRRPTILAPLTPIIPDGSPVISNDESQAAAAFGAAVARTAASPRMKLQRGRSIC